MSIQRRRLKSGRTVYDVRLRDPGGRVYTRTFPTRREAEGYQAKGAGRSVAWRLDRSSPG